MDDIFYISNVQSQNNTIMITTKDHLPLTYITLADFGYSVISYFQRF